MFRLTPAELVYAKRAIERHGYSVFFPEPPEWQDLCDHWDAISSDICDRDLDVYRPHRMSTVFAPKDSLHDRPVHLLHPEDMLIYTALVLIIRNDIERSRISKRTRRVHSFRIRPKERNELYGPATGAYQSYLDTLKQKATKSTTRFVAVTDIADFFPRIYQHRLENALSTLALSDRSTEVARVLVRKLICHLMAGNSYGIPVGPYASRVLGEAVLIDVDDHLLAERVDFVRWVDDYNVFAGSRRDATRAIRILERWLYARHGLTLQTSKTHVFRVDEYMGTVLKEPGFAIVDLAIDIIESGGRESAAEGKRTSVEEFLMDVDDYDEGDEDEVDEEGLDEWPDHSVLLNLMDGALSDEENLDLKFVELALRKLSRLPSALTERFDAEFCGWVVSNIRKLGRISPSVAGFLRSRTGLSGREKRQFGRRILRFLEKLGKNDMEFAAMWLLTIFESDEEWNQANELTRMYANTSSETVRRGIALALARAGSRAQVLSIVDQFDSASPLHRLSLLKAARQLGKDERRHWRLQRTFDGVLESKM